RAAPKLSPEGRPGFPRNSQRRTGAGTDYRRIRRSAGGDQAVAGRNGGPTAVIVGQDKAVEAFTSAWGSRRLHHAWLLAGPTGVGKAGFPRERATGVLGEGAGPPIAEAGLETSFDHPMA